MKGLVPAVTLTYAELFWEQCHKFVTYLRKCHVFTISVDKSVEKLRATDLNAGRHKDSVKLTKFYADKKLIKQQ